MSSGYEVRELFKPHNLLLHAWFINMKVSKEYAGDKVDMSRTNYRLAIDTPGLEVYLLILNRIGANSAAYKD